MLLDGRLRELLCHEASHGGLSLILALNQLQVTHLDQYFLLHPCIAFHGFELPLDLVLIRLLFFFLAAVQHGIGDDRVGLIKLGFFGVFLWVSATADSSSDTVDAPLL